MAITQQWWEGKEAFPLKDLELSDTISSVLMCSNIPDVVDFFRKRLAMVLPDNITPDFVLASPMAITFLTPDIRDSVVRSMEILRADFQDKTLEKCVEEKELPVSCDVRPILPETLSSERVSEADLQGERLDIILADRYKQEDVINALLASVEMSDNLKDSDAVRLDRSIVTAIITTYWSATLQRIQEEAPIVFSYLMPFLKNRNLLRRNPASGSFTRPVQQPSSSVRASSRVDTVREGALTADMVRAQVEIDRAKKESDRLMKSTPPGEKQPE